MSAKWAVLTVLAGALTLFVWQSLVSVAFPGSGGLTPLLFLRNAIVSVCIAALLLGVAHRLPRLATPQYASTVAMVALAAASAFHLNGSGPDPFADRVLRTLIDAIGFAFVGIVVGGLYHRASRVRTDEWGGVRAGK